MNPINKMDIKICQFIIINDYPIIKNINYFSKIKLYKSTNTHTFSENKLICNVYNLKRFFK